MAGQRQKAPEHLQGKGSRHRGTRSVTLLPNGAKREVPTCPRGVSVKARAWYMAFVSDPISQLVTSAAWPVVLRLVELRSERETVEATLRAERTGIGSKGQESSHPLLPYLKELTREIERIENGLGVLPQSQMRLGIALGQARDSLHSLDDDGEEEVAEMDYDAIEAEFAGGGQ